MIRPRSRNTCEYPKCEQEADEPGTICRMHRRYVPKVLLEQLQWTKKQIFQAIKAGEEVR